MHIGRSESPRTARRVGSFVAATAALLLNSVWSQCRSSPFCSQSWRRQSSSSQARRYGAVADSARVDIERSGAEPELRCNRIPIYVSLLGLNLANVNGGKHLLTATAAFRNEPYAN
jgi:hypothetical protein